MAMIAAREFCSEGRLGLFHAKDSSRDRISLPIFINIGISLAFCLKDLELDDTD